MVTQGTQTSGTNTSNIGITWNQPASTTSTGTIKLVETNYGCTGDTSTLSLTIYKLRIGNVVAASACKGFGLSVSVNADGAYYTGNTYTAQLSDAAGNFAAPVNIGSAALVGNGVGQAAAINAIIPSGIPNGTGYKVRIISSNPVFTGDTSAAISILKPDVGADQNHSYCMGRGYNLTQNFADNSLSYQYFTQAFAALTRPDSAEAGTYQVIGANAQGCTDTALVTLTGNPSPALGADTTVLHDCPGETSNLNPLYNTTGLSAVWNTATTSAAPPGTYRLVVTNSFSCTDTAFAIIKLETATWLGTTSSDWHTAANWSTGKVPTDKTHVIITGSTPNPCIIINANATAASIQVRNGGTVQTSNNKTVDVKGKCFTLPAN